MMTSHTLINNATEDQQLKDWHPLVQQQLFRGLMHGFSYPGRVVQTGQEQPIQSVLATLVDNGLPLADTDGLLDQLFLQRLGCHLTHPEEAAFIVCSGTKAPTFTPCIGSLESPEKGATVLIAVASFRNGTSYQLRGPGVQDTQKFNVEGLDSAWIKAHQLWRTHYPMGVDLLLVSEDSWIALPRTLTIVEEVL